MDRRRLLIHALLRPGWIQVLYYVPPKKKYYVPPQITKIIVSFPRHELHIEDVPSQLHCFWLFLSKRCIFQLLLWHYPAHHCQSFQSWSRRGSAHLLNFSISPPWIHIGLGLRKVLKKVLKKALKKILLTQKRTQKSKFTFLSTQKSTQ